MSFATAPTTVGPFAAKADPHPEAVEEHARDWSSRVRRVLRRSTLEWLFPPTKWLLNYDRSTQLVPDALGGLVMAVMFIPMGLGYASLLGIPIQIGLYTAAVQSITYFTVGGVACLSMGPVAEITLMLLGTPSLPDDPAERGRMFASMAFTVGLMSLILSAMQGGEVIRNSLARAVGNAYSCAAGVVLTAVQLKDAFNLTAPSTVVIHSVIYNFVVAFVDQVTWKTLGCFVFFAIFFVYLTQIKRVQGIPSWVPHQLIAVALSTFLAYALSLDSVLGLHIVGKVPDSPPSLSLPSPDFIAQTWSSSVLVALVSFLQMYSIATKLQSSEVDATKELMANGCCSFLSGLIGGFPGSSSFSRCLVLSDLKAKTTLNSLIAGVLVVFAATLFTGLFYYLPKSVLAAIIMAAVLKLIDFSHALWLWRYFPADFAVWATVFSLTLFVGVAVGILSGIIVSTLIVLYRVGRPPSSSLGYDMATQSWLPVGNDPELLLRREILVWSFDAPCYFINANFLTPLIVKSLQRANRPISFIVISCLRITGIDSNSVESLVIQLRNMSKANNVSFCLCHVLPHVRSALEHQPNSTFSLKVYDTIDDAVFAAEAEVTRRAGRLFPSRPFPAVMSWAYSKAAMDDEVIGFVAVVSHGDRSPKQKIKIVTENAALIKTIFESAPDSLSQTLDRDTRTFAACLTALQQGDGVDQATLARRVILSVMCRVLQNEDMDVVLVAKRESVKSTKCTLVVKWGGTITTVGAEQAVATGKALVHRLRLANSHRAVVVTGTSAGAARVTDTGRLFLQSLCGAILDTMEVPELSIDKSLDKESLSAAAAEEVTMAEISRILHFSTKRQVRPYLHVEGMKGLVAALRPTEGPRAALLQAAMHLQNLIRAVRSRSPQPEGQVPSRESPTSTPLADHEAPDFFVRRYSLILGQYLGRSVDEQPSGDERSDEDSSTDTADPNALGHISELAIHEDSTKFQVSKVMAIYDNMVYDMIHNAEALKASYGVDIKSMFPVVQRLYRVVASNRCGLDASQRLIGGALRVHDFLTSLRGVVTGQIAVSDVALTAGTDGGAPSPLQSAVRVDCFFTSTTLVEGLRHCISHCDALDSTHDKGVRRALERLVGEGWHYFSHMVVRTVRSLRTGDIMVELLMSPGSSLNHEAAHALTEQVTAYNTGDGLDPIASPLDEKHLFQQAISALTRVGPLIRVWRLSLRELEQLTDQIALIAAEQQQEALAATSRGEATSPR